MTGPAARGLSAAELASALTELRDLVPATVLDAVALTGTGGNHDVLLVLRAPEAVAKSFGHKIFVHIALGGPRARVATTARRFGKADRARGPGADLLQRELVDAQLHSIETADGERRCAFVFATENGARRLVVELFGARGLWAVCDQDGKALSLSRSVETAVRRLRLGDTYTPPPPAPATANRTEREPRFQPPVLAAIDAHFTALDLSNERQHAESSLRLVAERGLKKARTKADGLQRKLADQDRPQQLRSTADLMLAFAHTVPRGADRMTVEALDGSGETTIELDPSKPVTWQANRLYDKARRLDDGRAMTESRHRLAQAALAALAEIVRELDSLTEPEADALAALRARLQTLGALPKPKPAARQAIRPGRKHAGAVPFRRFSSAEGYPIFVGRNNAQNDELTMRFANGNDLWLHVGGGRPGSHVVVRLPKQKTASLETLLDAAALAVHYSKARGEPRIDVIYTHRKHVKKPKGLPPGAVVPAQTKTITVLHDEARLGRVLDSAAGE